HSGGGGRAARCLVCRAEAYFPALQRLVLSLRQRRRGAALQPALDRCRNDQAALTMSLASFRYIATKERLAGARWLGVGVLAAIHLVAITVGAWTEYDWVGPAIFMLAWALLNFTLIALLRRPALSAGLSF